MKRVVVNGRMSSTKTNELMALTRYYCSFETLNGKKVYIVNGRIFDTWAEVGHHVLKDINEVFIPNGTIDLDEVRNAKDDRGIHCFTVLDI